MNATPEQKEEIIRMEADLHILCVRFGRLRRAQETMLHQEDTKILPYNALHYELVKWQEAGNALAFAMDHLRGIRSMVIAKEEPKATDGTPCKPT